MPNLNITNIPAPRVPFMDERTGLMAREWYRFFLNLFVLTGNGNNPITLEELQLGPPNQPDLTELLIQINQNIAPQYEDQSGDFLATLDTAQLMSMMSRFENAEAAIQGVYLQPVVQTGTIASYNLDGSPTAGGVAYGTGPALAVSAAGTVGQVLTSGGAGTPTWAAAATGTVTSVAALTLGTSGTDLSSTVANGTTTPVITLQVPTASASNRGALSAADWTTFNSKGSGTVTSVTGTAPVVSSGGATPAISMAAATTSVNGYLTNTDWTTFNSKQPAGSYLVSGGALGTPSSGTVTNLTGTASININGTVGATTPTTGAFTTGAFQAVEGAFTGVQVGTGSAGNIGWILGNASNQLAGIWSTGVTPSTTNYSIRNDGGTTLYLNAATNVITRIGNVGVLDVASTGLSVTGTLGVTGVVTMSAYGAGAATFSAAGVISSVSDETWKIKDGIPTNPDAMLQKLAPGYWYYNDEKKETFGKDRQLGFYAQNVNAAIGPEAAPEPEEGKPWGYYDRSVLAVTVMSLQKALATIAQLTVKVAALERNQADQCALQTAIKKENLK